MKDTTTRDKLLEARKDIVKEYESAVLDWSEYFLRIPKQAPKSKKMLGTSGRRSIEHILTRIHSQWHW